MAFICSPYTITLDLILNLHTQYPFLAQILGDYIDVRFGGIIDIKKIAFSSRKDILNQIV